MTTKKAPSKDTKQLKLKKPEDLDFHKGKLMVEKVIRENQEWLKEMANR